MEITKDYIASKFDALVSLTDEELKERIDKLSCGVFDELRVLVEQMTCNSAMNSNYLIYEARLLDALSELKWHCGESFMRNSNKSLDKQNKI